MTYLLPEDDAAGFATRVAWQLTQYTDLPGLYVRQVALAAVEALENELFAAAEFERLRDAMCRTMADPDVWDGDDTESGILIKYTQHLAKATHGDCQVCWQPIPATALYEVIGHTGGPQQREIIACVTCV